MSEKLKTLLTEMTRAFVSTDTTAEDMCDAISCDVCPLHSEDSDDCRERMSEFLENILEDY